LKTLLIHFGAGVAASDCVGACHDTAHAGRWIIGLSLVIFALPFCAHAARRVLLSRARAGRRIRRGAVPTKPSRFRFRRRAPS
jgi:hypothetical protein